MEKLIVGLLALLTGSVALGCVRKLRGRSFLPERELWAGEPEPQSLPEMVERNRREASDH